jgi:hypothetical protein
MVAIKPTTDITDSQIGEQETVPTQTIDRAVEFLKILRDGTKGITEISKRS